MGTNYSFLLQSWRKNGCYGSLQQNNRKSLVVRAVVVAEMRWRKKSCKKNMRNCLEIRKRCGIFAVRKVISKAVRQ